MVYGPKIDDDTGEIIDKGRGVQIYKYVQQGSFDEFMWQAVEKKAAGIKAITKRHVTARETEDVDEFVLSAAEAQGAGQRQPEGHRAGYDGNQAGRHEAGPVRL